MSTLGIRLRQVRQERSLSQYEFAEALGISQSFLSDVERDVKVPGGDMLLSLKRSYGVSIDWLLSGELDLFTEGSRIGPASRQKAQAGSADRKQGEENRVETLEARVAKLEAENQYLKGRIAAYKEILGTLRPTTSS